MEELFDFRYSIAGDYLQSFDFPWQALCDLSEFISSLASVLDNEYIEIKKNVWVHKTVNISEYCVIDAPCIISSGCEIRHGAYIRGNTIIGKNCVIGNSCEIKNSVIFDGAQIAHFNYIGDSVIGYKAHFGAGSVTSNLKCDKSEVVIRIDDLSFYTGLRKLGAMVGDGVEIGCNVTLNPGTVIERDTVIYPNLSIRGHVKSGMIYKSNKEQTAKRSSING